MYWPSCAGWLFSFPRETLGHEHDARGPFLCLYACSHLPTEDEVSEKEEVLYAECLSIFPHLVHIDCTYTYKEHTRSMSKIKQLHAMDELDEQEILAQQDPGQVAL